MRQFVLHKQGEPKNLKLEKVSENFVLKKNEVLIKHTAIGVNYFDIHFRNGQYTVNQLPAVLGLEACGIVEAVGPGVVDYKVGKKVAYATGPIGAYCEMRLMKQHLLVNVPAEIPDAVVAGSLLKGLMAHTLLYRAFMAVRAKRILVHAAAGGVGQFLCSWAKELGLEVIGTVGDDSKIAIAKKAGCDRVINYRTNDFVKEVEKFTQGAGVGLVYDGVGKDTFIQSLACLWPMGMCINYGEASGPVAPFDINHLLMNSLYVTKPTLALYKANRVELALGAAELFTRLKKGILNPQITTHRFEDLPKVHEQMEKRLTTGSQVLVFNKK